MLSSAMQKALNDQFNEETASSFIYLSMAAWFKSKNFNGFAHWFEVQAREEWGHAMKFYNYTFERRGRTLVGAVKKPPTDWKSPLDVFEAGFKHEQHITACIDNLVELARKEKDNATLAFLQYFITEQVEEEANFDGVVSTLRLIGDHTGNLFMMDHRLGSRG